MQMKRLFVVTLISGLAAADERPREAPEGASALLEAGLETSGGLRASLRAFADKPLVVFYEARGSANENQRAKDALFAAGKERGLLEAVAVVGVANLQSWNWVPAKQFARVGVAQAERQAGVPVLIDWTGVLTRPPMKLSAERSTILVVHQGEVRFRRAGALSPGDSDALLATLEALLERGAD